MKSTVAGAQKEAVNEEMIKNLLQTALDSSQGFSLYVEKIGTKHINKFEKIKGSLICFKQTADMIGFAVQHSGNLRRSYKATTQKSMQEFLAWVANENVSNFKKKEYVITPGSSARFDCPS